MQLHALTRTMSSFAVVPAGSPVATLLHARLLADGLREADAADAPDLAVFLLTEEGAVEACEAYAAALRVSGELLPPTAVVFKRGGPAGPI